MRPARTGLPCGHAFGLASLMGANSRELGFKKIAGNWGIVEVGFV